MYQVQPPSATTRTPKCAGVASTSCLSWSATLVSASSLQPTEGQRRLSAADVLRLIDNLFDGRRRRAPHPPPGHERACHLNDEPERDRNDDADSGADQRMLVR